VTVPFPKLPRNGRFASETAGGGFRIEAAIWIWIQSAVAASLLKKLWYLQRPLRF
jgi:hypothetical protein